MADVKPVKVLAERHGGLAPELKQKLKQQQAARKEILGALTDEPRTVAQIADATGLPKHEVLWYLMAFKKYGDIVEGDELDDCYTYALKNSGV